jgi:hypothetical protein
MSLEVASPVVRRSSSFTRSHPKALKPFDSGEIKILLLENVNQSGISLLEKEGYQVNCKLYNLLQCSYHFTFLMYLYYNIYNK